MASDDGEELVTRAARDYADQLVSNRLTDRWEREYQRAKVRFTVVLNRARAEGVREGYRSARADLASGAFIGGPTYEALRDSFSGQKIAAEAVAAERDRCAKIAETESKRAVAWDSERAKTADRILMKIRGEHVDPGFEHHEPHCHLQHGLGGRCTCR